MSDYINKMKQSVNLTEFAASEGFNINPNKSTESSVVMGHSNGSKITIAVNQQTGHWVYFDINPTQQSGGSIFDLVMSTRKCGFREALQIIRTEWSGFKNRPKVDPSRFLRKLKPLRLDSIETLNEFVRLWDLESDSGVLARYLEKRSLSADPLFSDRLNESMRTDAFDNIIFPHHQWTDAVIDDVSGWELKNNKFTGFGPKGGSKGIWTANTLPTDRELVFVESGIEALSYYQLHPEKIYISRCVSTGGAWGKRTKSSIEELMKSYKQIEVVSAFNNDKAGDEFYQELSNISNNLKKPITQHKPKLNDWNDDLLKLTK